MNSSNPTPTPAANSATPASPTPFPQTAARICLALPVLLFLWTFITRSLSAQVPFLAGPGGAILSALLCVVIAVTGLAFGVVALVGIPRYGGKNILGHALAGMTIHAFFLFIVVTNFVSSRSQAKTDVRKLAETRALVDNLREEAKTDTSANAGSSRIEKMQKHIETAAKESTGTDAALLKANALFLKKMQETSRLFEDAAVRFDPTDVLDLKTSGTKEALAAKRASVQEYLDTNAKLRSFLEGAHAFFRAELVKGKVPPADIEAAMASLNKGFGEKLPTLLRLRDGIAGYSTALLALVDFLDAQHGKWSVDEATLEFQSNEELEAQYADLLAKIEATGDEQDAAEAERQKMFGN